MEILSWEECKARVYYGTVPSPENKLEALKLSLAKWHLIYIEKNKLCTKRNWKNCGCCIMYYNEDCNGCPLKTREMQVSCIVEKIKYCFKMCDHVTTYKHDKEIYFNILEAYKKEYLNVQDKQVRSGIYHHNERCESKKPRRG